MAASANQLHIDITADCTSAVDAFDATKSSMRSLNRESATVSVNMSGAQDAADQMEKVRQARMNAGGSVKVNVNSDDVDQAERKMGSYRQAVQGLAKDLDPIGRSRHSIALDSGSLRRASDDADDFSRQMERSRSAIGGHAQSVRAAAGEHESYSRAMRGSELGTRGVISANEDAQRSFAGVADRADDATARVSAHEQALSQLGSTSERSFSKMADGASDVEASSGSLAAATREVERHGAAYRQAAAEAERFQSVAAGSAPRVPAMAMAGGGSSGRDAFNARNADRLASGKTYRDGVHYQNGVPRPSTGGGGPPRTPPPSKGYGGSSGGDEGGDDSIFSRLEKEMQADGEAQRLSNLQAAKSAEEARKQRATDALKRNKAANDRKPGLNQWAADSANARAEPAGPTYEGKAAQRDDPASDRAKSQSRFGRADERRRRNMEENERAWQAAKDSSDVGRAEREELGNASGMSSRGPGGGPPEEPPGRGLGWLGGGDDKGDGYNWGKGEKELRGRLGGDGPGGGELDTSPAMMGSMFGAGGAIVNALAAVTANKLAVKNDPGLAKLAAEAQKQMVAGIQNGARGTTDQPGVADTYKNLSDAEYGLGMALGQTAKENAATVAQGQSNLSQIATQALRKLAPAIAPDLAGTFGATGGILQGLSSPSAVRAETATGNKFADQGVDRGIANAVSGLVSAGSIPLQGVGDAAKLFGNVTGSNTSDGTADTIAGVAGAMALRKLGPLPALAGAVGGINAQEQLQNGQDPTGGLAAGAGAYSVMRSLGKGRSFKGIDLGGKGTSSALGLAVDLGSSKLPTPLRDIAQGGVTGAGVASLLPIAGATPAGAVIGGAKPLAEALGAKPLGQQRTFMDGVKGALADILNVVSGQGDPGGAAATGGIGKMVGQPPGPAPGSPGQGKALPIPTDDQGILNPGSGAASNMRITPQGMFQAMRGSDGSLQFQNTYTSGATSSYASNAAGGSELDTHTPSAGGGYTDQSTTQDSAGNQIVQSQGYQQTPQGLMPFTNIPKYVGPPAPALPAVPQPAPSQQSQQPSAPQLGQGQGQGSGGPIVQMNPNGSYSIENKGTSKKTGLPYDFTDTYSASGQKLMQQGSGISSKTGQPYNFTQPARNSGSSQQGQQEPKQNQRPELRPDGGLKATGLGRQLGGGVSPITPPPGFGSPGSSMVDAPGILRQLGMESNTATPNVGGLASSVRQLGSSGNAAVQNLTSASAGQGQPLPPPLSPSQQFLQSVGMPNLLGQWQPSQSTPSQGTGQLKVPQPPPSQGQQSAVQQQGQGQARGQAQLSQGQQQGQPVPPPLMGGGSGAGQQMFSPMTPPKQKFMGEQEPFGPKSPNDVNNFDPSIAYHGQEAAKTGKYTLDPNTGMDVNPHTGKDVVGPKDAFPGWDDDAHGKSMGQSSKGMGSFAPGYGPDPKGFATHDPDNPGAVSDLAFNHASINSFGPAPGTGWGPHGEAPKGYNPAIGNLMATIDHGLSKGVQPTQAQISQLNSMVNAPPSKAPAPSPSKGTSTSKSTTSGLTGQGPGMSVGSSLSKLSESLSSYTSKATQATQTNQSLSRSFQGVGQQTNTMAQSQPGRSQPTQQTAAQQNSSLAQSFTGVSTSANTASAGVAGFGNSLNSTAQSAVSLQSAVPAAMAPVGDAISATNAAMSGLGQSAAAAGSKASSSMAAGISEGAGQAASAAGSAAAGAAASASAASDSHSPSRVFMQIGRWMADGMEIGLQQGAPQAASAAAQLAQAAIGAASNAQSMYNTALSGGFGAGIVAASNGVTPIAQDYGLMIGYSWAENVVTGAQSVLQSSQFTALTTPQFGSALAQSTLGAENLLPPAGSGAEYYTTTSGNAGMVSMTPVQVTNQIYLDGSLITTTVDTKVSNAMNELANSINAQRG